MKLKIVTFNIRLDCGGDGACNFSRRRDLILEKIRREQPDIICFQEVLPHVAVWLRENLKGYYVVGCGRDRRLRDEQTSIAYRPDRLNLMKLDIYWLSETPMVPASRYPDQSICPRICTEAVFEDLASGIVLRVANTHLDHESPLARSRGLKQILAHLAEESFFPQAPVILAGDMNAEPDSREMAVMKEYPAFTNVTEGIGVTYHGFHKDAKASSIDYIFLSGGLRCESVEKWTDERGGIPLSDHYPICAVVVAENLSG